MVADETTAFQRLKIGYVILAIGMILGLFGAWNNDNKIQEQVMLSAQTTKAVCLFRDDLTRRVQSTRQFLQEHPEPMPFPGVSRITLETNLKNQEATLRSLSDLPCKEIDE